MNDIDWIMQKKVGFVFKTITWKDKIYNYILEHSDSSTIHHAHNSRDEAYIRFKNGDTITIIPCYATRGHVFSQVGYEYGIPNDMVADIEYTVLHIIPCIEIRIDE